MSHFNRHNDRLGRNFVQLCPWIRYWLLGLHHTGLLVNCIWINTVDGNPISCFGVFQLVLYELTKIAEQKSRRESKHETVMIFTTQWYTRWLPCIKFQVVCTRIAEPVTFRQFAFACKICPYCSIMTHTVCARLPDLCPKQFHQTPSLLFCWSRFFPCLDALIPLRARFRMTHRHLATALAGMSRT